MDKIVNRSDYRIMENQQKNALQRGKDVKVMIDIVYDGENKRPKEFNISCFFNGNEEKARFSNGGA